MAMIADAQTNDAQHAYRRGDGRYFRRLSPLRHVEVTWDVQSKRWLPTPDAHPAIIQPHELTEEVEIIVGPPKR